MEADDPRHGTPSGYAAGCHCADCREAKRVAMAEYRKIAYCQGPRKIPILGTVRRVQALACLGWTARQIAEQVGRSRAAVIRWSYARSPLIHVDHARAVADAYDRLCMTFPPYSPSRTYVQRRAWKLGWFPPLAWDNIDDPDEYPGLHVLWGEVA